MADIKISALPSATTPLVGTEVLPIVQSSTTVKVAISDITAGRAVLASSLSLTTPLSTTSGGTGVTTSTGSGDNVLSTSPTLVTPILGTPTSGTLTNCVGLPIGGISATGTPSSSTFLRGDGSWQIVSSSPGGSSGQVQYNSSGAFAGSSGFTYDGTTLAISGTGVNAASFSGTTSSGVYTQWSANAAVIGYLGSGNNVFSGGSVADFGFGGNATNKVVISTNNQARLTVDNNGGVGIGTVPASATYKLDVYSTGDLYGRFLSGGTTTTCVFYLTNGNGTTASKYSYFRFVNFDTNNQDYRLGTYGTDSFSLYDGKASAYRIIVDTNGATNVSAGTATPAGGSTGARLLFGTTAGFGIYYGSGAPTVSAAQGSIYLRSDGSSTSTRLYVNTTGSTTWTNVTTAA